MRIGRSTIPLIMGAISAVAFRGVQPAVRPGAPVARVTGSFFALSVPDLATAKRWYMDKLGLSVKLEIPKSNGAAVVVLEGGGLTVELEQRDDAKPLSVAAPGIAAPDRIHGLFKVGFMVDDLDATLSALRARGVEVAYGPFRASATQPANVIIKDGTGNLVQIIDR